RSVLAPDQQDRITRRAGTDFQESQSWLDLGTDTSGWVVQADFSALAVAKSDGVLEIWDVARRAVLRQLTLTNGPAFLCAVFSNGTQLVTAHSDNDRLRFNKWDLLTSALTQSWVGSKSSQRWEISPNGRWCFTFRQFGGPNLLTDTWTGRETTLNLRDIHPVEAAFSPDGALLAIASDSGYLTLWETHTLREAAKLTGFLLRASSVAFSSNGRRLAAGSNGKEAVKIWDVDSHLELLTLEGSGSLF